MGLCGQGLGGRDREGRHVVKHQTIQLYTLEGVALGREGLAPAVSCPEKEGMAGWAIFDTFSRLQLAGQDIPVRPPNMDLLDSHQHGSPSLLSSALLLATLICVVSHGLSHKQAIANRDCRANKGSRKATIPPETP